MEAAALVPQSASTIALPFNTCRRVELTLRNSHLRLINLSSRRAGIAYDQSPVKTEFRTPRIPDADRTWLAFGAQYRMSPRQTWDFGYAHLFVKDSTINKAESPVGGTLIGTYKNDVNLLSVQYSHAF